MSDRERELMEKIIEVEALMDRHWAANERAAVFELSAVQTKLKLELVDLIEKQGSGDNAKGSEV